MAASLSILRSENLKELLFFLYFFLFADSSLPPLYRLPFLPAPLSRIILHPSKFPLPVCFILSFLSPLASSLEILGSRSGMVQSIPSHYDLPPTPTDRGMSLIPQQGSVVPSGFRGAPALCGKQGVGMRVDRVRWDISPLFKRSSHTHTWITGSHQRGECVERIRHFTHGISVKSFAAAILFTHFTGGETEAWEAFITCTMTEDKRQSCDFSPDTSYPSTDGTVLTEFFRRHPS